MQQTFFTCDNNNEDRIEVSPYVDKDGKESISFSVDIAEYEELAEICLSREDAKALALKILEVL